MQSFEAINSSVRAILSKKAGFAKKFFLYKAASFDMTVTVGGTEKYTGYRQSFWISRFHLSARVCAIDATQKQNLLVIFAYIGN